ncbi:MAG: hypothetical protein J6X62_03730 [Bacteroidales bacterium]|nr:hypothetical protein [Bacteroidales bacterium]
MGRIFIKEGFPISVFIKEDDSKETTMWVLKYNLENDERAVLLCGHFYDQKWGGLWVLSRGGFGGRKEGRKRGGETAFQRHEKSDENTTKF